ncbi:MAG: hypothetical protein ACKPJJ_07850 [Planctomycetaceae bacterium]
MLFATECAVRSSQMLGQENLTSREDNGTVLAFRWKTVIFLRNQRLCDAGRYNLLFSFGRKLSGEKNFVFEKKRLSGGGFSLTAPYGSGD